MSLLATQIESVRRAEPRRIIGTVAAVRGLSLLVDELPLPVGSLVRIEPRRNGGPNGTSALPVEMRRGEVIGFQGAQSIIMLLGHAGGIAPGMRVVGEQTMQTVQVGQSLLGRVVDALGSPIDGRPFPADTHAQPLHPPPSGALDRRRVREPLPTGVRALDGFLTVGRGQRLGIFSGPGVGKSTLLGMIARNTSADVNVIALIGERGREVRDFIEDALGEDGLQRSVVVVATGDQSPLLRVRAAFIACSIAEYFRDAGADVMLMMDSITRFAQAQRQIGLAVGEAPATRGYTPSVFSLLPVLLERAGPIERGGSITGFYAVLVESDDMNEPISDAARGVLDGHIVLSRKLTSRGHFPAIDVLQSISRLANDVSDPHHRQARQELIRLLAAYADAEELINIGAYARGSNPETDAAIVMRAELDKFLRQSREECAEFPLTCRQLLELSGMGQRAREQAMVNARGQSRPAVKGPGREGGER